MYFQLIFKYMSRRTRSLFWITCLLPLLLISFQNCGQKFKTYKNTEPSETDGAQSSFSTPTTAHCANQLNKCTAGSFVDTADSTTENKWSCLGLNGGASATCYTSKSPTPTPTPKPTPTPTPRPTPTPKSTPTPKPTSTPRPTPTPTPTPIVIHGVCSKNLNQCTAGSFFNLVDSDFQYQWSCLGSNGGASVTCATARPPTSPPTLPIVAAPRNVTYLSALDLKYPGANGDVSFDFYHPADYLSKSNLPVFIWVHGGGWSSGDKADDRAVAQNIADRGFIVLNLNYTLAPAVSPSIYPTPYIAPNPYTAGVRDILAAVELVKLKASNFHIDSQKISIGGGSAGGHLALMTSAAGATIFNCVISAAGPTDLLLATQMTQFPVTVWIAKSIYGNNESVLKAHSPLYQVDNIQARRVYLIHQEKDNLVPISHARNFLNAARPRFQSAIETTFFNDPLPAGIPYESPAPSQITHNFDATAASNAISNFLANKCY